MPLTGTGVRIGSATQFGAGVRFPRGMASDGTTLYLFDASRMFTLDVTTGVATRVGNLNRFGANEGQLRGACFHNGNALFYGNQNRRFYTVNLTTAQATSISQVVTIGGGVTIVPDLWGLASLDGNVYAVDRQTDALYTANISTGVLTRVSNVASFGVSEGLMQSLATYNESLIGVGLTTGAIYGINHTTGVATAIQPNATLFDTGVESLEEHDGQVYAAGSAADALFRLVDVRWDAPLADREAEESTTETLDLATVSQDGETYSFTPNMAVPAGATIVGSTLRYNIPAVNADTDVDIPLRVTHTINDGETTETAIHDDTTLTYNVQNIVDTFGFGTETIAAQSYTVGTSVNVTLPEAENGTAPIRYEIDGDLPTGLEFFPDTRRLTGTPSATLSTTTFTYRATDRNFVETELEFTITVDETPLVFSPTTIANQTWVVGDDVNLQLPSASGGAGDIDYSLTGTLPGVIFTANDRQIAGTVSGTQTATTYRYTATDEYGQTESIDFTITVNAVLDFSGTVPSIFADVGDTINLLFPTATGGHGGNVYSIVETLPAGLSFSSATRRITGSPTTYISPTNFTYRVTDSEGDQHEEEFEIDINQDVTWGTTTVADQSYTVGTAVDVQLPAAEGEGTIEYSIHPSLPAGLTFNQSARRIEDTPTAPHNSSSFRYRATIGQDHADIHFNIAVAHNPMTFSPTSIADMSYEQNATVGEVLPEASGGAGEINYAISPALPAGLTFTENGRTLSGTPTAITPQTEYTYTATDAYGQTLSLTFNITITEPLGLASAVQDYEFDTGENVNVQLPAGSGGSGGYQYSIVETLPAGLSFSGTTRRITGTPTAATEDLEYTYRVTDSNNDTYDENFNIDVDLTVTFGTETVANQSYTVGTGVSVVLPAAMAEHINDVEYSLSPALPTGLEFDEIERRIFGTPSAPHTASTFTYTATEGANTATLTFTITVAHNPLVFDPTSIADQVYTIDDDVDLDLPVATGGAGTLNYSLSPTALPAGLEFSATGRWIVGSPTAEFTTTEYTYTVTDGYNQTHSITFDITVSAAPPIVFDPTTIPDQMWTQNQQITPLVLPEASGGVGDISYSFEPSIPMGLQLDEATRTLSGTPTFVLGLTTYRWEATDEAGTTARVNVEITVSAPSIVFSPTSIADHSWVTGLAVNLQLPSASGGTGTIDYSLSPALPTGLSFNETTRRITGTPSATLTQTEFTYTATDENNVSASLMFDITVEARSFAWSPGSIADQSWAVGDTVDLQLPEATGGAGTLSYSLSPTLPAGLSFSDTTRRITGEPTATFTQAQFTYTVTDAENNTDDLTFNITVEHGPLTFDDETIDDQLFRLNQPVDFTLPEAVGGETPIGYALTGTLPTGLSFNEITRAITGTPSAVTVSMEFTYTATDNANTTVSLTFHIEVEDEPIPPPNPIVWEQGATNFPNLFFIIGEPVDIILPEAESESGGIVYSLTPTLGFGLSFDADTRNITGTPNMIRNGIEFRYAATDAANTQVSFDFRITVRSTPYNVDNEDFVSLLPSGSTTLEKNIEIMMRENILPVESNGHARMPILDAWNPDLTDLTLVPYLGVNLSVLVDTVLSEDAQRTLLKESYSIHRIEGTPKSILNIIMALGYSGASLGEGVADEHGVTHWANYNIQLNENVPIAEGQVLLDLIKDLAPLRCKLVAVDVTAATYTWDGTIDFDGTYSWGTIVDAGIM